MNDQEFEKKLNDLMTTDSQPVKKKKKKKRRRVIAGIVIVAAVFLGIRALSGSGKDAGVPVLTQTLEKGDIQEILSISGPVSGTDSAEVVSKLHAEILDILVKEGDPVEAGQILARLDTTDAQREVDIARNACDLAVAEQAEAQTQAEIGYGKAVQELQAAQLDYQRKEALYAAGDIAQADLEAARDALGNATRNLADYTVVDGRPVANQTYDLKIKNAEFELAQKNKNLTETEVKSPIAGTVVRVNTSVGRFADIVDDDKPLFAINNLESLEMKINVSEYSIGKVKVGQEALISADILDGGIESGVVTAISPTGEEKGGGSSERVIPTTIKISSPNTRLIAGINAKAEIVLEEASDTWVVPVSAVAEKADGSYLAMVEENAVRWIPVTTGVESDIQIEVTGDDLREGLTYIITPDIEMAEGTPVMAQQ